MGLASIIAGGGVTTCQAATPNLLAEQSERSELVPSRAEVSVESSTRLGVEQGRNGGAEEGEVSLDEDEVMQARQ